MTSKTLADFHLNYRSFLWSVCIDEEIENHCSKPQNPLLLLIKLNSNHIHFSFLLKTVVHNKHNSIWTMEIRDHKAIMPICLSCEYLFFPLQPNQIAFKKFQYEQMYKIEQEIWTDFIGFKSVHELLTHCYGFAFYTCSSWNNNILHVLFDWTWIFSFLHFCCCYINLVWETPVFIRCIHSWLIEENVKKHTQNQYILSHCMLTTQANGLGHFARQVFTVHIFRRRKKNGRIC